MGLFVLWWGWLAFNSGSTYGLSGAKWHYAPQASVMTMISSFGGGTASIIFSMIKLGGRIDALDIINGILGSLVAVTAGCFLYQGMLIITECVVKSGQQLSKKIKITKGLKQGSGMSPTLFKIYVQGGLNQWCKKYSRMGIEMGESNFYTMLFADDQIILANYEDDIT